VIPLFVRVIPVKLVRVSVLEPSARPFDDMKEKTEVVTFGQ